MMISVGVEVGNPDKAEEESQPDGAVSKRTKKARRMKSPMKTKWIVPLLLSAMSTTPNLLWKVKKKIVTLSEF